MRRLGLLLVALLFAQQASAQIGFSPVPRGTAGGSLSGTYPNPGFASPNVLGVAQATSLAAGGCTIGANALCGTGTLNLSGIGTAAGFTTTGGVASANYLTGDIIVAGGLGVAGNINAAQNLIGNATAGAGLPSAGGYMSMSGGDSTHTGYIQWFTISGGTGRTSYMGFDAGGDLTANIAGGHFLIFSTTAVPTAGSGAASVAGTDQHFVVTAGTAQTSITANFGRTWAATPVCTLSSNSTASVVDIASISTTAITFGASVALTGTLLYVLCGG